MFKLTQILTSPMSRWEKDSVFYKVMCVCLLAVALVFCLVLTDVFMDIDGLLHVKKDKTPEQPTHNAEQAFITTEATDKHSTEINNDKDNSYRTKRSSESENLLYHVKQSKIKNLLSNRLASLLDQLDAEDTTEVVRSKDIGRNIYREIKDKQMKEQKSDYNKLEDRENLLHSAMHEILLLALRGHMEFNEVYQHVHTLTENFEKGNQDNEGHIFRSNVEPTKEEVKHSTDPINEERKLIDEMLHCKKLKDEIAEASATSSKENKKHAHEPKLIIKTIIDINSLADGKRKTENLTDSRENIRGLVKLIYNGKSIKFTRLDDEESKARTHSKEHNPKLDAEPFNKPRHQITYDEITDLLSKYRMKTKANNFLKEYLKQYQNSDIKENTKRLKRHIKIRYENDDVTENPTKKKDDDELFVEIETHFDSKGIKGDKKNKLISNLVEKIQKAIHASSDKKDLKTNGTSVKNETKLKKHAHIQVKKRIQNPLNRNNEMLLKNKIQIPLDAVIHRQLNPIAKSVPLHEPMPYVSNKYGQTWQRNYYGPGFLAVTKSINSAEMSEVGVDYDKMNMEGVSQRMQKPLNNEISVRETPNVYYDLGKLKFFVKDIAGSGFSVGFNQYVDEQPDPEAMKLFTGLENIIQTYHQTYDQAQNENEVDTSEKVNEIHDNENDPQYHTIARRSIEEQDHHSNEYRLVFENRHLPYDNYEDIINDKKYNYRGQNVNVKTINAIKNNMKPKEEPLIFDEDILEKKLKPSEIFGIANLLHRRKRSINVQKISNLKNKIKLSRYLNTKAMATKRIFLNKKRNKRQAEKIRIIAHDDMPMHKHSDEIFVVSDENVLADRAVVREVETPEMEPERVVEDHYDVMPQAPMPQMAPQSQIPYVYEEPMDEPLVTNIFDGRSRHNSLMSKYPHILLEEIARSREEDIIENPVIFNKFIDNKPMQAPLEVTTVPVATISNVPVPKMEEIVKAITPQNAKTNYRVTVKILPKNVTDLNSGFKEIHTSINKSYNRNGLLYSSLVNVSEISKIVKINKTNDSLFVSTTQLPVETNFRRQQEMMNHILKQHRHQIEEQLNHLHKEREKLEKLSMKNDTKLDGGRNEYMEIVVPSNPPKVLKLTREEVSRLAVATLIKFNERVTTNAPSTLSTAYTTETPQVDTEKIQMISKMERNENITNEILKKIDKNTQILQMFLQKMSEKMLKQKIETDKMQHDFKNIQTLKSSVPAPFNQVMPNMEATNGSHVSIPFIYAYQQPYALPVNKPEVPVASVVYHGHIHTNTINGKREWHEKPVKTVPEERKLNQTKFFIDELENDYKVIPADVKKNVYADVRNNTMI